MPLNEEHTSHSEKCSACSFIKLCCRTAACDACLYSYVVQFTTRLDIKDDGVRVMGLFFFRTCSIKLTQCKKAPDEFSISHILSVKREKTNKMQQSDVYYRLLSQHVSRENQQDATIRCLLSTSVSTCFGHHYAHLQENKDRVTAYGVLLWFCWMWLVAVVGRCVVGCEHCSHPTKQRWLLVSKQLT